MKKKYYLTLDTETCTLPFVNQLCRNSSEKDRQNVSISKPLVYDIGWVITDRQGNVIKTENYLVQETFFVPNVFNTAYYKEKRPFYMDLYQKKAIKNACWNDIVDILIKDLDSVDLVCAYNATFDFKKAIPFTERYIEKLYSPNYNEWEQMQKRLCKDILNGKKTGQNKDFLKPYFKLRNKKYPLADLWTVACDKLINIDRYRNYCLDNQLFTNSALYFKTSAETSFQYLALQHDFKEQHTALADSLIEAEILTKALKKGKVEPQIKSFPFKELGTTYDYAIEKKKKYIPELIEAITEYIDHYQGNSDAYLSRVQNIIEKLADN